MLKSEGTHKRRKILCNLSQSLIPKSEEKEERSCLHCLFSLLSTSDPETTQAKSDRRKCEISREESLSWWKRKYFLIERNPSWLKRKWQKSQLYILFHPLRAPVQKNERNHNRCKSFLEKLLQSRGKPLYPAECFVPAQNCSLVIIVQTIVSRIRKVHPPHFFLHCDNCNPFQFLSLLKQINNKVNKELNIQNVKTFSCSPSLWEARLRQLRFHWYSRQCPRIIYNILSWWEFAGRPGSSPT